MENNQKNIFMGMSDVGQAEEIINQFRRDHPGDTAGAESLLNDLMEALDAAEQLIGDFDSFHNFAVTISKMTSDNKRATDIVRAGLKIHPMNTDLLADAIKYGYSCGEKENCKQWFSTLNEIDKSRWSWRAFSFSVDYLLAEWISSVQNDYTVADIHGLAKDYQHMKPYEEDAWLCEFDIYDGTNQREQGIAVLEEAISRFRFCPRCWLRYADIMMERGEYEAAEPIIRKMCRNPKTSENINASYMFFLDAQCKLTRLYNSDAYENGEIDELVVWNIYKAFRKSLASPGLRLNTKTRIDEYIMQLSDESGIEFPDEWRGSID